MYEKSSKRNEKASTPPMDIGNNERDEKITRILEIAMLVVFTFLVLCLIMTF